MRRRRTRRIDKGGKRREKKKLGRRGEKENK